MSAQPEHKWTVEEYLAFERDSQERHEFWNGEVFAMTGASRKHTVITGNVYASLHGQLRKSPCEVYQMDMRVNVSATGLYTYPDVSVVCDKPLFTDDSPPSLLNPTLIIEVLSPSTEKYDRGKKFQDYRKLESLQEYLLVAQEAARIEHYVRQPDGKWTLFSDASSLEETITLPSIDCTLALADVYEKVTFEGESA
ncbi:MAG: Uma2 family endonuclease [Anaerolineae bacterium]